MASWSSIFKRLTMHIEACMGARACMRNFKPRESRVRGIRVARLMREVELAARRPRHRSRTARSDPSARFAPNAWDRDVTATRPQEKWNGDMTAIWRDEGWLSLAAGLELFSRQVRGWAMAASADETLVEMAVRMALLQPRPQAGVLHHTDRGCQDTSPAYQALRADVGIPVRMSRKGNCWDNAAMESFFGPLKPWG